MIALCACATHDQPFSNTIGSLPHGATVTVRVADAPVRVYKPAFGDPADRFTIAATALAQTSPPPPTVRRSGNGIVVNAPDPLRNLLVRIPEGTHLEVQAVRGDISVTDVNAPVNVRTGHGNITVMVPSYAQAETGEGHVSVTIGAQEWPGTLKVTNGNGDTEVWINETAHFRVHLHTENGTLFTDFALRGTSQGTSETIDAAVNGGGPRTIDIEAKAGTIRLLRLAPQA